MDSGVKQENNMENKSVVNSNSGGARSKKLPKRCSYCGKSGHVENRCFAKKRDNRQGTNTSKTNATVSNVSTLSTPQQSHSYDFFVMDTVSPISTPTQAGKRFYLVDSGATGHISKQFGRLCQV